MNGRDRASVANLFITIYFLSSSDVRFGHRTEHE